MRFGLALPHYPFSFPSPAEPSVERVVSYAARAEELGFDSVWVSDHLFLDLAKYGGPPGRQPSAECLTLMSAIAARTSTVRIGSLVLCAPLRNPAVLAQAARSLQDQSGGRIELGLGAGWNEPEFAEAGLVFGTAGSRIAALRAYAGRLRELMPDGPPLWVGGKGGPKIMQVVAEHADGWNVVWQMTPERYDERLPVLEAACAHAGREASSVRRSVGLPVLLGTDEDDVARRFAAMQRWTPGGALDGVSLEAWTAERLAGTPKGCAAVVDAFAARGVEEIILSPASLPFAVHDDEQLALIAEHLFPLAR